MEIVIEFDGFDIPKTNREGKGKNCIFFPMTYCVVDIETTGLSPEWDDIIEIGAIRYSNGKEVDRFQSLVQPPISDDGTYIGKFIEELTGITNEMLKDAPLPNSVIPAFSEFLGNDIILGYNVGFDVNFLYDSFEHYLGRPLGNDYIDVMRFARKLFPEMQHHRLRDMSEKFDIRNEQEHRSLSDVLVTEKCYEILCGEAVRQYGSADLFYDSFRKKNHKGSKAADIIGDTSKADPDNPLYNQYCVFTGKLERFTRKQAMQIVANLGGINEDNVTQKTNYLILGNNDYCSTIKDGKSSKQKKAEKQKLNGQDIEVIPETVFYDMIGDIE